MAPSKRFIEITCLLLLSLSLPLSCSSVEKKVTEVVPVDNGEGVPGVVILHDYDEDAEKFRGLLLDQSKLVLLDSKDVSGSVILPRNRTIELLSKEAALAEYIKAHPEIIDEVFKILQEEEDRIRSKVN